MFVNMGNMNLVKDHGYRLPRCFRNVLNVSFYFYCSCWLYCLTFSSIIIMLLHVHTYKSVLVNGRVLLIANIAWMRIVAFKGLLQSFLFDVVLLLKLSLYRIAVFLIKCRNGILAFLSLWMLLKHDPLSFITLLYKKRSLLSHFYTATLCKVFQQQGNIKQGRLKVFENQNTRFTL